MSSAGVQGNDNSTELAMTPDARYIAFTSSATNLVPGYGNAAGEVYVRDRKTHTTRIASLATPLISATGAPAQCGVAGSPTISDDGRYVAFAGECRLPTDLAALPLRDVYVRDMKAGATTRISVAPNGDRETLGDSSDDPVISGNGQIVAFTSTAVNLVAQPTCSTYLAGHVSCGQENVYARNLKTKVTTLVSADSGGTVGDGSSQSPSISADGRYVVFTSAADNLGPNDANVCTDPSLPSCPDVYLRDLKTNAVELISVGVDGRTGIGRSGATGEAVPEGVSANGRYVAFRSAAMGLVPNSPLNYTGIYVRDRLLHRTERASVDSDGVPLLLGDGLFGVDRSGRFIAFNDVESALEVCKGKIPSGAEHDLTTGATLPAATCATQGGFGAPSVSAGGQYVAFSSSDSNLVGGDTNKKSDIFLRDHGSTLGVDSLARGKLTGASSAGVLQLADATGDAGAAASDLGLDLRDLTVAYRPAMSDLFVRVEVDHMPLYALASPAATYTVDLTVGGDHYELRAGKTATGPSFAVFRSGAAGWSRVADVRGGYGTTGEEIVAAVPMAALGAAHGARVTNVSATSGFGSVDAGVLRVADTVTL
jgi:Tol biopolymer transport system component